MIYTRENTTSVEINYDVLMNKDVEQIWCSVQVGNESILCGCIYRAGNSGLNNCQNICNSVKFAYDMLAKKKFSGILLCGDFNFPNIVWYEDNNGELLTDSDEQSKLFFGCISECYLNQNVIKPNFQESIDNKPELADLTNSECPHPSFDKVNIEKKLINLNPYKSVGVDKVNPKVLKECAGSFSKPLSIIFNESYESTVVPDMWLRDNVTPLFKKGERLNPGNYRPGSYSHVPNSCLYSIGNPWCVISTNKK